jgi:DNA mismatch endonuclease (patch repair protein)
MGRLITDKIPAASSEAVRRRMQATRQKDTPAEVALRRELHRRGLRYRVHRRPVPNVKSHADIVFPRECVAVFVDGCFWHGCPDHGTWPKANAAWWGEKIEANRVRDRTVVETLELEGWAVLRIWAHEPPQRAGDAVEQLVRSRRLARDA